MRSYKLMGILLAGGFFLATSQAEVIEKFSKPEDGKNFMTSPKVVEVEGTKYFTVPARSYPKYISKTKIKVDPNKKYKVSMKLKQYGEEAPLVYIGFVPYTASGKTIGTHHGYYNTKGSLTTLSAPAEKGSSTLMVKDASKWKKGKYHNVAFNAKEDMSDTPNFDISYMISKIEKEGDAYKITLDKPLTKSYPAGTKVRQHRYGSTYIYLKYGKAPKEWTVWKGKFGHGAILRKADYIRPLVMINAKKEGSGVIFTDFIVEEEPVK
jgi:hypothetical protein